MKWFRFTNLLTDSKYIYTHFQLRVMYFRIILSIVGIFTMTTATLLVHLKNAKTLPLLKKI